MENQKSVIHSQQSTICLSDSGDGKRAVRNKLKELAAGQKMWGKSGEDVAGAVLAIESKLGHLPVETVVWSIGRHYEISSEFPSPSDLLGWIRRGGKPPYERSVYVKITKKEGSDRTEAEWEYMKAYEAEVMDSGGSKPFDDPHKYSAMLEDSVRMRKEIIELKRENAKLDHLLKDARAEKRPEVVTKEHRIGATAIAMRKSGAECSDILEFLDSMMGAVL